MKTEGWTHHKYLYIHSCSNYTQETPSLCSPAVNSPTMESSPLSAVFRLANRGKKRKEKGTSRSQHAAVPRYSPLKPSSLMVCVADFWMPPASPY